MRSPVIPLPLTFFLFLLTKSDEKNIIFYENKTEEEEKLEVKNIRIKIVSDIYDITAPLLNALDPDNNMPKLGKREKDIEHDHTEVITEAELIRDAGKTSIRYTESELSGMGGTTTEISFCDAAPEVVIMNRGGSYMTSFVFESAKRHICVYNTPIMAFEMGVNTKEVKNRLLEGGFIVLDYVLEIRGAGAERNRIRISLLN